ncbi:hypothetical protein E4634_18935 [Mangrovimicrobium sediminis]|uniref:EthD family reductase n=1 Tax=Mangrovimicrobium sediminis TaxID=2562682 RepID=A0A4Z0LW31_9GAMM|nr:DUF4286 family protein [Haliea sp. SAOS-164]TGD71348.1 hypothetical protein E4634_18935 [Haliea sp. SAOS-164]
MASYKFVVLSRPVEGREDEYNEWYQTVHLPELTSIPGIQAAQRFRMEVALVEGDAWPYMSIYELETDDVNAVLAQLTGMAENQLLTMTDAIDLSDVYAVVYGEFGERVITT